jgi:predicted ATPase
VLRALAGERDGAAILSELGDAAAELLGPDPGTSTAKSREVAGEDARFRLFYRICQALREAARRGPRLIVLDDLHWADAPSLLLLRFAARELADCGLLFLGTYRDVELRRGHPLASLLGELARLPHFQRLLLRGSSSRMSRAISAKRSTTKRATTERSVTQRPVSLRAVISRASSE